MRKTRSLEEAYSTTKDKDGTIVKWVGGGETWYGPGP